MPPRARSHLPLRFSVAVAAILALLAMVLSTASAPAQDCDCCEPPWICSSPQLTGDWNGTRTSLAESGVSFLADNTSFYFGNAAGGVRQGFDYSGHGDYSALMDGGRLGVQEGLFLKLRAEHRYGESITNDAGTFFSPTILSELPVANSERLYLTNVLLTQMLSESFAVFAGKFDTLDGDMNAFAHGRGKTQFSNLGFVFNPVAAATVPYSTLGAGFSILDGLDPIVTFCVLNPVDTSGTSGFEQLFADGVLLTLNVRLPTQFFDRPGHQLFGATWNNRTYNSIGDAYFDYPNVVIPTREGSWSLFWNSDQYLVVDAKDPTKGWGTFARAGLADNQTNPLAWFLSFGIGGSSPLVNRPGDTFGAGWFYVGSSNQIGTVLTRIFGPIGDAQGMECFYNIQVTPAVRLTPDLQVILPARKEVDASLLVGLRAQLIF